jgi:hypothetical protein
MVCDLAVDVAAGVRAEVAADRGATPRAAWPGLADSRWLWSRRVRRRGQACWSGRGVSRPGPLPGSGRRGSAGRPDECEYAQHRRGHQPELSAVRCGLPVGRDDGLHPGRIAECRPDHVDDHNGRAQADRRQQPLADLAGIDSVISAGGPPTGPGGLRWAWLRRFWRRAPEHEQGDVVTGQLAAHQGSHHGGAGGIGRLGCHRLAQQG